MGSWLRQYVAKGYLRLRQFTSWPPAASSPLGMLRLGGGENVLLALAAEPFCSHSRTYCLTSLFASSASAMLSANASTRLSNRSCKRKQESAGLGLHAAASHTE